MSTEGKINEFDTDEIVKEMQIVMKKGLSKVLKEFIDRYELLEKTHKQIMQLPSVLNELNQSVPEEKFELNNDNSINKDVEQLHSKINALENKLETGITTLFGLIQTLSEKILQNKEKNVEIKPKIQSSIFTACENENIKVEIKEDEVEEEKEVEEEDQLEEEDEVEEEDKEVEEEDQLEEEDEEDQLEVEEEVETEASSDEEDESLDAPLKVEEEEDEELIIISIDDVDYCTNDEENGFIWQISDEGEQGDKVGYLKEGEPFFYEDEK